MPATTLENFNHGRSSTRVWLPCLRSPAGCSPCPVLSCPTLPCKALSWCSTRCGCTGDCTFRTGLLLVPLFFTFTFPVLVLLILLLPLHSPTSLLFFPTLPSLSSSSSPLLRIPFRRRRLRACLGIASKEVCVRAYRPCVRANTRSCISCNCFTCPPATKENRTRFPRDDPQHPALQLSTTCSPDTFSIAGFLSVCALSLTSYEPYNGAQLPYSCLRCKLELKHRGPSLKYNWTTSTSESSPNSLHILLRSSRLISIGVCPESIKTDELCT